MSEHEGKAERLLQKLKEWKDNTGVMAELRRGLNPSMEDAAWPHIARWGCDITSNKERIAYLTTAGAFAQLKGNETAEGNMGSTCRALALGDQGGGSPEDLLKTFETRFRRLLSCHSPEELASHLRGVIIMAASKGVPVNYVQLFKDIRWWDYDGGTQNRVKVKWASRYWQKTEN